MDIRRGKGVIRGSVKAYVKRNKRFRNTHFHPFFKVHGADHFSYHLTDAGNSPISP